jgi:hypothetical protein
MATNYTVWGGTEPERDALLRALASNCACTTASDGTRTSTCASHGLLLDQRMLDHLLFVRRLHERLRSEEFSPAV